MEFDTNRAIWAQLLDEWVRRIATGQWQPGERVPSVRELAVDQGVNPNTVQRSLTELEATGLAVTQRTTGRFVTDDTDLIERRRTELATVAARDFISIARGLRLGKSSATKLVDQQWDTAGEDDHHE